MNSIKTLKMAHNRKIFKKGGKKKKKRAQHCVQGPGHDHTYPRIYLRGSVSRDHDWYLCCVNQGPGGETIHTGCF